MKLTYPCPKCKKPTKIQAEFALGNLTNYVYQCGHVELRPKIQVFEINNDNKPTSQSIETSNSNSSSINEVSRQDTEIRKEFSLEDELERWYNESGIDEHTHDEYLKSVPPYIHPSYYSVDGSKCAYEYQRTGVQFAEKTQLNCLFADAMGVGKTIEALITLKRNKAAAFPCLIIVKGATIFQWAHEFQTWVSTDLADCIPVTKRSHLIPGFNVYILSMDMLAKDDIIKSLLTLNLKTVVIDEVQNFKSSTAKRIEGLIKLLDEGNIQFKIALSGTPIKNRVTEYGPILNILAPAYFPNLKLDTKWLGFDEKGKLTKLNPYRINEFKDLISRWVIRREKHEVLKNLPDLTRDYQLIEIDDKNLRNSYNHTLDLFKNWLNDNKNNKSGIQSTELLGWLAQLRAITGQAKCKNALEWIQDFLESTDESIAVGIQHHSVRDTLYYVLEGMGLNPLKLSGEDSIYRKSDIVRAFTRGDNRILVINSLAGGVGLNLQTCANALILERQWNGADEEQFEARFHRDGQQKAVTITYMIAKGTIDEFFHDLVLSKRKILVETGIGSGWDLDSDIASLHDLCESIVSHKI